MEVRMTRESVEHFQNMLIGREFEKAVDIRKWMETYMPENWHAGRMYIMDNGIYIIEYIDVKDGVSCCNIKVKLCDKEK